MNLNENTPFSKEFNTLVEKDRLEELQKQLLTKGFTGKLMKKEGWYFLRVCTRKQTTVISYEHKPKPGYSVHVKLKGVSSYIDIEGAPLKDCLLLVVDAESNFLSTRDWRHYKNE